MDTTHPPPAGHPHQAGSPGGSDGFDELAARLTPELRAYAARRVAPDDVDDIVQETLLSLWRTHAPGQPPTRALAFRVADRRIADHFRAAGRHRRRAEAVATQPMQTAYAPPEPSEPPAWLAQLSPEALEVLLLVVDGLSVSEIAQRLDLTPGAVSSRLSRLRDRVPHLIGDRS